MYYSSFVLLAMLYQTLFAVNQPKIIFNESLQNINQEINQQKNFIDQNIGQIGSDIILRPVIANPSVSRETLDSLVDEIVSTGNDIIRNIPFSS